MYSAAMSSPREGVLRPSRASAAMNDRCPRSESPEMRSSIAPISGVILNAGFTCCALRQHAAMPTTKTERRKPRTEIARFRGFKSTLIRQPSQPLAKVSTDKVIWGFIEAGTHKTMSIWKRLLGRSPQLFEMKNDRHDRLGLGR